MTLPGGEPLDTSLRRANLQILYRQRYHLLWEGRITLAVFLRIEQEYANEFWRE